MTGFLLLSVFLFSWEASLFARSQRQCSLFLPSPSPPSHLLIQPFICTKELMALLDNNVIDVDVRLVIQSAN